MLGKALAVTVFVAAFSLPAAAQQQAACAKRGDVLKHLSAEYTEAPVAIGLANNGGVVEVLSSKKGQQLDHHHHDAKRSYLYGRSRRKLGKGPHNRQQRKTGRLRNLPADAARWKTGLRVCSEGL